MNVKPLFVIYVEGLSILLDMTRLQNSITVNHSNIPILSPSCGADVPYGQFLKSPCSEESCYDESIGICSSQDLYLPNFSLRIIEGKFNHDAVLVNKNAEGSELLGSCLFLRGSVRSFLSPQHSIMESSARTQNFKYDPNNEFRHVLQGDEWFHILHFSYSPEYFNQFLPESERWAQQLKNRINNRERILGERAVKISLAQERALQTIFDTQFTGTLGYMIMETAIAQIILLQLHALFSNDESSCLPKISKRDVDVMHELKQYLSGNFLSDHSMVSLSKSFGVNTNKLMSLFKKLFGKSIFEYISELRMDYAKQLLQEDNMLVTEVARTIGYKNPNHFSAAFKKRFGICPSELR